MVLDRDAAAVVGDGEITLEVEINLNEIGVSGDRLIHRIVDDFGKQVMQRLFVGTADIHARAHAHRLKAFEDADRRGTVVIGVRRGGRRARGGSGRGCCGGDGRSRHRRPLGRSGRLLRLLAFFREGHSGKEVVAIVHGAVQIFILSWAGIRRRPKITAFHATFANQADFATKHLYTRHRLTWRAFPK